MSQWRATNQCTEEIHSLQHQLLVSDPSYAELLQVLVRDLQQLFSADLFAFEVAHVLLEAVVQPWTYKTKKANETDSLDKQRTRISLKRFNRQLVGAPWLKVNKR